MHCCNINKSRRGGFFLVHLVQQRDNTHVCPYKHVDCLYSGGIQRQSRSTQTTDGHTTLQLTKVSGSQARSWAASSSTGSAVPRQLRNNTRRRQLGDPPDDRHVLIRKQLTRRPTSGAACCPHSVTRYDRPRALFVEY